MSRRRRNETDEQRARRELISDFLSAANIQSMDDIQELFKEALSGFMEGSLESELDSELGYEPYDVKNKNTDNSRNGYSKKTLRTSMIDTQILQHSRSPLSSVRSICSDTSCGSSISITFLRIMTFSQAEDASKTGSDADGSFLSFCEGLGGVGDYNEYFYSMI